MASIVSATLKITVSSNKVTPVVSYKLSFTQGDLNLMKQYPNLFRVRCELWGADSGFNGSDDKLFVYPVTRYYPDGTPGTLEEGSFTATLNKGAELDEDWESRDEVYGRIALVNSFCGVTIYKKSNEVSGAF